MTEQQLPAWADPSVSPAALDAQGVSRRRTPAPCRPVRRRVRPRRRRLPPPSPPPASGAAAARTRASPTSSATTTSTPCTATTRSTRSPSRRGPPPGTASTGWCSTSTPTSGTPHYGAALEHEEILKARADEPAPADLPGPGVVHPGRRALHGVRRARPARGRPAHAVRARLRRQAAGLHRGIRRRRRHRPQRGARRQGDQVAGRAAPHRATSTTSSSSPTTRCAWASTPRTRCGAGATRPPRS